MPHITIYGKHATQTLTPLQTKQLPAAIRLTSQFLQKSAVHVNHGLLAIKKGVAVVLRVI